MAAAKPLCRKVRGTCRGRVLERWRIALQPRTVQAPRVRREAMTVCAGWLN